MSDDDVQIHHTPTGREYVRTPDNCFENLEDFDYTPNYVEIDGLRVHYVDEGPSDGQLVLMLHGQPDWSYLYRKMIPLIVAAGHRVIVPDLIGMGRSDKPIDIHTHTVNQHVAWMWEFISTLGLSDITLFCQDWGSAIGLRTAAEHSSSFARILAANAMMLRLDGEPLSITQGINRADFPIDENASVRTFEDFVMSVAHTIGPDMSEFFNAWLKFALVSPGFKPSQNLAMEPGVELTDGEIAAYDAPYPSQIYRTAIRTLPSMAALVDEEAEIRAGELMKQFNKPFLTVFGELDILIGSKQHQDKLIDNIPGAKGQPHDRIMAGHFIQESAGPEMAKRLNDFIAAN
ncbi:MAG: haloalkane dehalogenase [Halieaceae bacterium]|jgi:haloalkane dehalogenase